MPIGDRAILEIVVDQLVRQGFSDIALSVGHLSHLIRAVFDQRTRTDATITYVQEEKALGTAGPLRLVEKLDQTFLAMNGDVLTTLDYRALVRHHHESGNLLTIATHERRVRSTTASSTWTTSTRAAAGCRVQREARDRLDSSAWAST